MFVNKETNLLRASTKRFAVPLAAGALVLFSGALIFGQLSERIGRRYSIMLALIVCLLSMPAWAYGTSLMAVVLGSCFMQSGVQGAFGVIPAHLNELSPSAIRGLFIGFVYQLGVLCSSPLTPFQTHLKESHGYSWALVTVEICVVLSLLVIFGFGLSELMRELLVWWEINKTHTMGRYVFVPFNTTLIYEHLLGLAVLVFLVGWWLRRTRLGVALLVIGDDETMARQAGINVPLAKVTIFVVSSVFMTVVGAIMAPRFGYLTPNFAFNPMISFTVVIMALLGGMQRLWGPLLGVIPLIVLSELLQVRFPFWYSVLLGLVFMVIVYFLPRGVTGLVEDGWQALRRQPTGER